MRTINLNGQWDFVANLDPRYHLDNPRFTTPEMVKVGASRRYWQKVAVPGVWQKYGERYDIFEGTCLFAREIEAGDISADAIARLRCSGINYSARVFVNGKEVGKHEIGYTEFVMDVTGFLTSGTNLLVIIVDNRAHLTKWPACHGYFNYGGIHRDIALEIIDSPSLDNVIVNTQPKDGQWQLNVEGVVHFASAGQKVRMQCAGAETDTVVTDGRFQVTLPCDAVAPWSPETPQLYSLDVQLADKSSAVLDQKHLQCGFRTVEMVDGHVCVNDKPVRLRGICHVFDSQETGLVMTEEQIERDLAMLKDLGCNAVRTHYPMDRKFYDACDRAGLLVWIEPTIYCMHPLDDAKNTEFSDENYIRVAETMIDEMIAQVRNHPCVIIYGAGNECNLDNPEAAPFFRRIIQRIRQGDSTRLVSYAALYGIVGELVDLVDVLGVNSYYGWYDKCLGGKGLQPDTAVPVTKAVDREPIDLTEMRKMLDGVLARKSNVALLLTEFGADSVPGYFSNSRNLWSEDYHADLLREIITLSKDYPQIVGTFPFCMTDYRDPSKIVNEYWNELNLKGVVDYRRNRKKAYYALRECYTAAR